MKNLLYFILIVFLTSGCIDKYNPQGIEQVSDLIVIDGSVTNGESVFKISRSVGLLDNLSQSKNLYINDASVYVEKDNGERIEGTLNGEGKYTVVTGELDAETKYRLYVAVEGEEYRSGFLSPIFTSEVDSISILKEGPGKNISVHVSTHDPKNQSRYYMWSYEEHWEVKAPMFANYGELDGQFSYFSLTTPRNTYYCWCRDSSRAIFLASTEKISENFIHQKKIKDIGRSNSRFSELYYIKVKQMQLRKEAYDYYSNVQKNTEQTGGLFSPMPSEIKGNIVCLANPKRPVIGYVEVTTITTKDIFRNGTGLYENSYSMSNCYESVTEEEEFAYPKYAFYYYMPPYVTYAPYECVDCRRQAGASKNRPAFWANDHY